MKTIRLLFFSLLAFFGIIYLIYVGYIFIHQQEMVFRASKLPDNHQFNFSQQFEEVIIPSYDGKKLHGILFKSKPSKGLIFYLHGNAGTVDNWGNNASIYTDFGYDIFFLDYRGFGKSEDKIKNEDQIFRDVLIAYDQIVSGYDKDKIVIIGYSIGTGLATYLASERNPQKLILQAPFYNFLEFTTEKAPYFPDFLKKFSFETNKFITKVKAPIYIFHGSQDALIPHSNSERLKKIIKSTDQMFLLENEDHVGINDNPEYQQKLKEILK